MNHYFTADLHFGHTGVLKFGRRNYSDIFAHDEKIVKRINHIVPETAILYVLGDVGFTNKTKLEEIIKSIKCRKILILGNHDKLTNSAYFECGFDVVLNSATLYYGKLLFSLNHAPYPNTENKIKPIIERGHRAIQRDEDWLLHGHTHGMWAVDHNKKMIDVGWDNWQRPLHINEILNIIKHGIYPRN